MPRQGGSLGKRRIPSVLSFLLFLFSLFLSAGETVSSPKRLRIIQSTDIHGQYSSYSRPGVMELAARIRQAREEAGKDHTLYIDCGDLFQGTFESASDKGKSMISFLNLLECDVFVPGNHDLDFGVKVLAENLALFKGKTLSCNWKLASQGAPKIFSYAVFRRAGLTVAVIGMSPRHIERGCSKGLLSGLIRLDALREFASFMPELMKKKPHLIILAMHEGLSSAAGNGEKRSFPSLLFRKWPQIDLVLGGHTHLASPGKKGYLGQWYVQAPPLAEGIGVIDVEADGVSGKILSLRSHIRKSSRGETDHAVKALLEERNFLCKKEGEERIGSLPFVPSPAGRTLSGAAGNPFSRLLGKAVREASGAPVAFLGYEGKYRCRSGEITKRRLFLLLPYETFLSTIPLTPEECRAIIEEQCKNARSGNFQTPSGIRYTFDGGRAGKELYDESGSLWESGERLAVFSSRILAAAGGKFPVLAAVAERKQARIEDLPVTVRDAAERYIGKHYGNGKRSSRRKGAEK